LCDKTYREFSPFEYYSTGDETGIIIIGYTSYLTDIVIPATIDDLPVVAIDAIASEDNNITSVFIPASVKSIGDYVFIGCENLTEVTFGANSQLETIGYGAFSMSGLTSIEIPDSVTSIGTGAFEDCTHLTEVVIYSKTVTFGEDIFLNVSEDLIIYGFAGSDVKEYARDNGIAFVAIDSLQTLAGSLLTALGNTKYAP
jgi:hypothetical protein